MSLIIECLANNCGIKIKESCHCHEIEVIEDKKDYDMSMLTRKKVKDFRSNKYLYAIYKAMKQVGRQHSAVIVQMNTQDSFIIDINERNYIIFLSYILGTIQGRLKDKIITRNDYINGELFKEMHSKDNKDLEEARKKIIILRSRKNNKKRIEKDYNNVRPDFVIHESHKKIQDDKDRKGQKLIIEAKASNDINETDFCWDFLKLNYYLEEYNFKNAIYLIVNTNIGIIEKRLEYYSKEIGYYCSNINKLWFFVQNWDGKKFLSIEIYQLKRKGNKSVVNCQSAQKKMCWNRI